MDAAAIERHREAIERDGYTIVPDVIEPALVRDLRDTIRAIEKASPNHVQGSILRTLGLLCLDPIFQQPPVHPSVLPLVQAVLGNGCLLTLFDSLDVMPGRNEQPLHNDDALMPLVRPHQPLVCTAMWALTDFTEQNGATRVVRGSQLRSDVPDYRKHQGDYETDCMEMTAGSVLLLDGAVWHTSGENRSEGEWRLGMQVSYCAGFVRPLQNFMLSVPRESARTFSDELLALCGYATFNGIGHIIRHGENDPASRSPAAQLLGREPLPDASSGHLQRTRTSSSRATPD